MFKSFCQLLRAKQYVKNLFILAPAFFAGVIINGEIAGNLIVGFLVFSLVASGIYIFNDIMDVEFDRQHPIKKNRPIAAEKISKKSAAIGGIVFTLIGLSFSYKLGQNTALIISVYLILNILYSLKLKHIAIIDIAIVSLGFPIRLYFGAEIANVPLSKWIVISTFLLAMFIALGKRYDDLIIMNERGIKTRRVIDGYNLDFVNAGMIIMAAVIIVSYAMYVIDPEVQMRLHSDQLFITLFFVLIGILRYFQLTLVLNRSGSPTDLVFGDRFLQLTLLGWGLTFALIIY